MSELESQDTPLQETQPAEPAPAEAPQAEAPAPVPTPEPAPELSPEPAPADSPASAAKAPESKPPSSKPNERGPRPPRQGQGQGQGNEKRAERPAGADRGPRPERGDRPAGPRGNDRPAGDRPGNDRPAGDRPSGDRGDRRGPRDQGRPGGDRGRPPEPPTEIDIEKLVNDSLYLDNQAHAVVARMRDMDSGTRSQLRRFYSAVRRACRAAETDRQHQFVMLRARLAYTIARHQLRSLDPLERLLLQVTRKNDARGYERFRDLFEAIVAYNE